MMQIPPLPAGTGLYHSSHPAAREARNLIDVFFVDMNGHPQQKWFDNGWKPLYQAGGDRLIGASPSAVAWTELWTIGTMKRLNFFGRGTDFELLYKYFQYSYGWSPWNNLGYILSSR
ncbi:MAG: hypothetical protein LUP95_03650 [Euryarchaeota archaeon]|nr:hypothetical protein [Euryarchaeota archaeon]